MKKIKFRHWTCDLKKAYYGNGRPALQLLDSTDGSLVTIATVNLPEMDLAEDEVFIKDYSENAGMYRTLLDAGVIAPLTEEVQTGFVKVLKCKLLV